MANPLKSEKAITVGEQHYTLFYDWDLLMEIEQRIKMPLGQLPGSGLLGSLDTLRTLLHFGLRKYHPEITLKEAGYIIPQLGGLDGMVPVIEACLTLAFPELPRRLQEARDAANPIIPFKPIAVSN
jgi:hypothetical protein